MTRMLLSLDPLVIGIVYLKTASQYVHGLMQRSTPFASDYCWKRYILSMSHKQFRDLKTLHKQH